MIRNLCLGIIFVILSVYALQTLKTSKKEDPRDNLIKIRIKCLENFIENVQDKSLIESIQRKDKPTSIVIHGGTEAEDSLKPHISIEPNGKLIRYFQDLDQANFNISFLFLKEQGLHIQIEDKENLAFGSPVLDKQYRSLAIQTLIWQIKYGISDFQITSEKPQIKGTVAQDLQMRFDWDKFAIQKNNLIKRCRISSRELIQAAQN